MEHMCELGEVLVQWTKILCPLVRNLDVNIDPAGTSLGGQSFFASLLSSLKLSAPSTLDPIDVKAVLLQGGLAELQKLLCLGPSS